MAAGLVRSAPKMTSRRVFRLTSTLKSCKRIFDVECSLCDKVAAAKARNKWSEAVSGPSLLPESDLRGCPALLRRRVRELTEGWGVRLAEARDGWGDPSLSNTYVPDQQGCFETKRHLGGTLATREDEFHEDNSALRVGVAKTKGKFRVVTMQTALVKRILTPVHNALYNHISSFDWCVRGDVCRATFESVVADRKAGESFISGDYAAASDGIYPWATAAMVDALLEDPSLTDMERRCLRDSFENLHWVSSTGRKHPIVRGQMMGSLVGFPLLCLLNKACFDISCDIQYGAPSGGAGFRVGRFNGDDCCFSGDSEFFSLWREVTSTFGLTVNEEKTGISDRFIELNSEVYDAKLRKLVAKPVLSFLRPGRKSPDDILPEVIRGVSTLKPAVRLWVVNDLMRHEIAARKVNVQGLSRHWLRILIRKKWFRVALVNPPEVREVGVDRSLPVVLGPLPRRELLEPISELACAMTRRNVSWWTGRRVRPLQKYLVRRSARSVLNPFPPIRVHFERPRWRFLWPKELLEEVILTDDFLSRSFFSDEDRSREVPDHPFLHLEWVFSSRRRSKCPLAYVSVPPPRLLLDGVSRPPAKPFELDGGVNL